MTTTDYRRIGSALDEENDPVHVQVYPDGVIEVESFAGVDFAAGDVCTNAFDRDEAIALAHLLLAAAEVA